ncbi:putative metal-dependent hydrolase [Janthinobacterium sp. CG_23.3]|uniref:M48 family metallopeptidase n=1 Tax=Janthinobacterium sp. CG_23.3 TaxID=3349634 RepID=UPI0038D4D318
MKSLEVNGQQLDLFAQDAPAAAKAPGAPPTPPAPPSTPPSLLWSAPPPAALPSPPRAPDAPPLRQLQLGQHSIEYELRRSTRRSIGFMIDDDGLRVTAPKRITLAEIDNAIRAKQGWILSKLHERRERRAQRLQRPPVVWTDGAALPYLGGSITLRLHYAARHRASINRDSGELHVWVPPAGTEQQLKEKVRAWLQDEARRLFAERLDVYAAKLGVSFHSFALSSAGTRWGSCTVQRKIRLNWRLIHFALPLVDYVVAHELAHLLEMNHSARFWATVESVYPDYDGAKQALRKRSQELPALW